MALSRPGLSGTPAQWRCPACLSAVDIPDGTTPTSVVSCPVCGLRFAAGAAQAGGAASTADSAALPAAQPSGGSPTELSALEFLAVAVCAVGAYYGLILFPHQMLGPSFLVYYGVCFVLLLVATWVLRLVWRDNWWLNFAALVVFEALGVHRYLTGTAQGMSKWGFLILMMVFGGLAFLFSTRRSSGREAGDAESPGGFYFLGSCSTYSGGSCSGGGGCGSSCGGGGGCGGGGCGGCGGS